MAINTNLIRRPSDRGLFLAAAIVFPLLVLIGYFKTYYFRAFFADVAPLASSLVHIHGLVMTTWVIYFVAQVALVRSKNLKLHMSMGFAGIGLAAIVVVTGMMTAWDAHITRATAPGGLNPHSFFIVPTLDMLFFVVLFSGAIYYRKRPAEHKALMLMTAINFIPAAVARIPLLPPDLFIIQALGIPMVIGIACLVWHSVKHKQINRVFAIALAAFSISGPLRVVVSGTDAWLGFVGWIAR